MTLEESLIRLIHDGIGDKGRLEHILTVIQKGNSLYTSDSEYLKKLLEIQKSKVIESQTSKEPKPSIVTEESEESNNTLLEASEQSELESIQKEIRRLQDRNHRIEEHLKNTGDLKRRSIANSFGRGVLGIFLFLFGLGMIFVLYYHFTNIDNTMRGMSYGGDPWAVMITAFVIVPMLLYGIGGTSIYYGIRIISKT